MEEELKKDHSDMQAVVDSKQKIIDAQVSSLLHHTLTAVKSLALAVQVAYGFVDTFRLRFNFVCVTCILSVRKRKGH